MHEPHGLGWSFDSCMTGLTWVAGITTSVFDKIMGKADSIYTHVDHMFPLMLGVQVC